MTTARFLIVLDADSTLIQDEVIELLADEAGRRDEVQAATEAAMRGDVDFATSLRARVALLAGVPITAFERVCARVRPTPGVHELATAVRERGGVLAVVSGGFHEVLDDVAPALGVDRWRANRLAVSGGVLTGAIDGTIVDAAVKASSLRDWARELGVPPHATIAVGDGANDLQMLAAAGLGIAFNAKPAVRQAASLVAAAPDLRQVIPLLP